MHLHEALNIQKGDVVSFVGGGGKTTALVRLGYELADMGWRVLGTTTTRIGVDELGSFPHHTLWEDQFIGGNRQLAKLVDQYRFVFVYKNVRDDKVIGIPPHYITLLMDHMNADVMLVEADGSRRLPLKAPLPHEPVIPLDTTLVVPIAGLDAVGQPLDENNVYNLDAIIERYGFPYGEPIQPAWIAQILRDEDFGLKGIPSGARIIPIMNKANPKGLERSRVRRAAYLALKESRINAVLIGAVKREKDPIFEIHRRVGVVILAAGLSQRMGGESKPLLSWGKRTVIEAIIQTLTPFRFADVVVVTGHQASQVEAVVGHLPARAVYNGRYATGEILSSLKVGLKALKSDIDACLVVMGDQPQLKTRLVRQIMTAYSQGVSSIIAPFYGEQRGHPILIQRHYWQEILDLPAKSAPREVIERHPVFPIPVEDDSILRDIDTPESYAKEKRLAGLE